jgi:hypothetical protein
MPITLDCDCGRTLKLRDELAGRRIKCPHCGTIHVVPNPPAESAEDAAFKVLDEAPEPDHRIQPRTRQLSSPPPRDSRLPVRPPRPDSVDDDEPPPRPRPQPISKSLYRDLEEPRRRKSTFVVSSGVVTGALMMIVAVIWFFGALALNWVFFYPPIMFVLGLVAFTRGLMGYEEE